MGGVMSIPHQRDYRVDQAVADPGPEYYLQFGSPGFGDLPESCIAQILRFITPKDIAKLACTSRAFRDAALSDLVWQAKLPHCYTEILAEAMETLPASSSKNSVYNFLCRDVLLKEGHEAFRLDKATGSVSRRQGARAMGIVWGSDQRYWDWLPREGSSFAEVAYLKTVCWLEVSGTMECTLPVGSYTLSWRVSLAKTPLNVRHALREAYGWTQHPVTFTLATDDDQHAQFEYFLAEQAVSSQYPGRRLVQHDWIEFDVGEFIVEEGDKDSGTGRVKLQYSLTNISGHWKGGMFLDGIVIWPSHLR